VLLALGIRRIARTGAGLSVSGRPRGGVHKQPVTLRTVPTHSDGPRGKSWAGHSGGIYLRISELNLRISRFAHRRPQTSGVGVHHHRQRACARHRWLRDQSRSRLYQRGSAIMASLHLPQDQSASTDWHRDRCAKSERILEGNAESELSPLRQVAPNLGARDLYRRRARRRR
jgi:hypothetical protein